MTETNIFSNNKLMEEMQEMEEKTKDLELPTGEKEVKEGTVIQETERKAIPTEDKASTDLLQQINAKMDLLLEAQQISL